MAAPNILSATTHYSKTAVLVVTTTATAILTNYLSSGRVLKVNGLWISNVDGTNSADITIDIYKSSTAYNLAKTISVPADSTIDFLSRPLVLEEGDTLRLTASADGDLQAICSYEQIASETYNFLPIDIAGLHLWLDASDSTTLFDTTSGGSLVAANGLIARWEDKSGSARHVIQSTTGSRPLRKTIVQNGLDGILFDGTADDLVGSINLNTRDCSTFVVFARTNSAGRTEIVLSSGDDTDNGNGITVIPRWDDNNGYFTAGYLENRVITASSIGTESCLLTVTGGSSMAVYKNGTTFGSLGAAQSVTAVSRVVAYIGSGRGVSLSNRYFAGHIFEVLLYNSVLSNDNRALVDNYLITKWGIT